MVSFEDFSHTEKIDAAATVAANSGRSDAKKPQVRIYTDGASRGNPGPGGYGAVLQYTTADGTMHTRELSAGYRKTTNNRMELLGVIVALETLKKPCVVELHSDSQYVVNAFKQHWVHGWIKRGWKTSAKQPVKNVDLWQRLLHVTQRHDVSWIWVKGHAGQVYNERCDELATQAADTNAVLIDSGFEGFEG